MRVLHLQSDDGVSGGVAHYVGALVRHRSAGVTPIVNAASRDAEAFDRLYGDEVDRVHVDLDYGRRGFRRVVAAVSQIIEKVRPDVVHSHVLRGSVPAALAARRHGIPLVYTNHGLRWRQKRGTLARATFFALEIGVTAFSARIVCLRETDTRRLRQVAPFAACRVRTLETRVDAGSLHSDGTSRMLLCVGSLLEVKRPDRFVEWVAQANASGLDVSATWVGDGPLRADCEAKSAALGAPVRWCGHLPKEAVTQALADARLFLLTSQFETFPLAVLESYAAGVPVIASEFEGVSDFLDHGRTGFIVGREGIASPLEAITALLSDDALWQSMSTHARERYEQRYAHPTKMAQAYEAIYREVIDQRV